MSEVAHNLDKKQELSEKWLPIVGYEGRYEVSDNGRVRSIKKWGYKILRCYIGRGNYLFANLYKSPKTKTHSVHRLVASTFIPNPNSLPEIDHIDANRLNNQVSNLRWVTHRENMRHAGEIGHMARNRSQHHPWDTSSRGGKRSGRILDEIHSINMDNKNFESMTFQEVWSGLNGEERNELARRLYLAKCCYTYQTLWNWGTGKVRPQSALVREAVAKTVSKFIGGKVSENTLFPRG